MTSAHPSPHAAASPHRDRLLSLIRELAIARGKVALSSGKEADYYVDLRRLSLHHEGSGLIGRLLLAKLDEAGYRYEAVGGLTLGADPVAIALMHAAREQGRAVDAFVVRKAAKAHGLQRRIEGPSVQGRRVIVVEDTSTTGGSPLSAVEAVRQAGGLVQAVAVIVDRATGAKERIASQARVPYLALFSLEELDV